MKEKHDKFKKVTATGEKKEENSMQEENKIVIGKTRMDKLAYIDESALNKHTMLMGVTGSGKSTAMMSLLLQYLKEGYIIITFNWRRCLDPESIHPDMREAYLKARQRIDVAKEGLHIPLFSRQKDVNGELETPEKVVSRVTNILNRLGKFTKAQSAYIREAVETVFEQNLYQNMGIYAIGAYLMAQERRAARNAAQAISAICDTNAFRDGDFLDYDNPGLYELDLNGFEYDDQKEILNVIIDFLLREANLGRFMKKNLVLVIDECQNLDFSHGSPMEIMLNESRKLGIRLLLAAPKMQTSQDYRAVHQCGTILHFAPVADDERRIARLLDKAEEDKHVFNLRRLQRGEFIGKGIFELEDGKIVEKPIKLSTYLPEKDSGEKEVKKEEYIYNNTENVMALPEEKEESHE